jgi:O-antigen/teichoic acid export membrane protein
MPAPTAARSRLLTGSLTLLAGTGIVSAANLVYNLAIARLLGPAGFGHATAVYTLLMLMSAVTLSFQIVCTKLIANHPVVEEKAAVYARLHHRAWITGITVCFLMVLFRDAITEYLNLPGPLLVVLLGVGIAFYIPLGVRRGGMQGLLSFNGLVVNLALEGLVRLGAAVLLIKLGMGVTGAVLACVAALVVAYLAAVPHRDLRHSGGASVAVSFHEGLQASVFFAGQVIINNCDIVLVKHFFPPAEAGVYAAVSLVGRVVNMCSWSVVNSMFPVSAGQQAEDKDGRPVLLTSMALVSLILAALILVLWAIPSFLWRILFGAQFELAGSESIAPLLILYAVMTGIYSLSSVIIAYEMSRKIANTGWVQLGFSGALVLVIYFFHATTQQVITEELALMVLLLVTVLIPVVREASFRRAAEGSYPEIRKLSRLSEDEVIAEFLKSEFCHQRFDEYRGRFDRIVYQPNLNDRSENSLRRALLFMNRGAMWRELPADTQWYEVELRRSDLARIRFFPRAHWRRVAQGQFYIKDLIERIRADLGNQPEDEFFCKLQRLRGLLRQQAVHQTVLLIGMEESSPLTILDGNHRIAAAMLEGPSPILKRFKFICGFSPHMTQCCWYRTDMTTLWRYAKNLVRYLPYDPESEIEPFLADARE